MEKEISKLRLVTAQAGEKHGAEPILTELNAMIHRISHWLPTQGPIKDFIHHNTLHAFQDRPFHEAIRAASHLFGARSYLDLNDYRNAFRRGEISLRALQKVIQKEKVSETNSQKILSWLLEGENEKFQPPPGLAKSGIHSRWLKDYGIELDSLVHPTLYRLVGNFLDQGISVWRMPHATDDFWSAVGRLVHESRLPISVLRDPGVLPLLKLSAAEAIDAVLAKLVGDPDAYESYLLEMSLEHPGWSGMVAMVEANAKSLLEPRRISLLEMLALELVLEYGHITRALGPNFAPLSKSPHYSRPISSVPPTPEEDTSTRRLRMLHEAFEWSYYSNVIWGLEEGARRPPAKSSPPSVQAYFCIDDRCSSIRRHIEEVAPDVATYATAGFFAIDFYFQAAGTLFPTQYCPVVIKPKHLVRESAPSTNSPLGVHSAHLTPAASNTLVRGWLLSQTVGVVALLRLAINVLKPGFRFLGDRRLSTVETSTELQLLREGNAKTEEGYFLGYSVEEMADRVAAVFRSTGLTSNFAPLVIVHGHGSSSANNPHFAAYDCGACSGRAGAPNARSFAWMANYPPVRAALRKRGIDLPDTCQVVGGLFDTTRDETTYFDTDKLSPSHRERLSAFRSKMEEALSRNAVERTRRFELAPLSQSPKKARAHVQSRSESIFEPRPELNHATNALCIVGRRSLTQGIFLDRRAFLNSYDPQSDPTGDILMGILNAVIPVCGGINLEYYFSRVDSKVYGAGTKLPHNVMSLVGVANGVEGDLQTGLPTQMTEVHDPVRLLTIVEQEPEIALSAITRNPPVFEWVKNNWVHYACFSPQEKRMYFLQDGVFVPFDVKPNEHCVPVRSSSLDVIQGMRSNIPVHFIGSRP